MSRRIIALLLLLACALSLGGWLVVGPTVATRSTPIEPPIDLDALADRAKVSAASSSGIAAASPGTTAVASSSVASAGNDKARCGEDQLAEYRAPDPAADGVVYLEPDEPDADGVVRRLPGETKAAGAGYLGALQRIDAALRSSGDAYGQAVADALNIGGLRSQPAQVGAVVQDAQTSHDARVESLAFSVCGGFPLRSASPWAKAAIAACAGLDVHAWIRDDPGNGVPWLYVLQQADQAGDRPAQREAMRQLASATHFDTRQGAAPATVAGVRVRDDADLAAQMQLTVQAIGLELGAPFPSLTAHCRNKAGGDEEAAATCDEIASRMIDHADAFMTQVIGGSIHKQVTGDATRLEQVRRDMSVFGQRSFALHDDAPCQSERELLQRMVLVGRHGEVALAKEGQESRAPH